MQSGKQSFTSSTYQKEMCLHTSNGEQNYVSTCGAITFYYREEKINYVRAKDVLGKRRRNKTDSENNSDSDSDSETLAVKKIPLQEWPMKSTRAKICFYSNYENKTQVFNLPTGIIRTGVSCKYKRGFWISMR